MRLSICQVQVVGAGHEQVPLWGRTLRCRDVFHCRLIDVHELARVVNHVLFVQRVQQGTALGVNLVICSTQLLLLDMLLSWFIEVLSTWGLMPTITTGFTKDLDASTTLVLGQSWLILYTFGPLLHLLRWLSLGWGCLERIVSFFAHAVRIVILLLLSSWAAIVWVMDWWFNDDEFYSRRWCQTFRVLSFCRFDDSFVFWVLLALQFS